MTQDPNPHEALAAIRAARESVPGPTGYPGGYDILYGGVCGLLVAGQGMPQPWSILCLVVSLLGLAFSVHLWRGKYGWWINGYSPKRARWVAFGLAAVLVGLIGLSLYGRVYGPWWLFIVSGVLGALAAGLGGRLWMRVWRRELAERV